MSEAIAHQGSLKAAEGRGEQIIVPSKITFGEVAEEWWAVAKTELRPVWAKECRRLLDRRLLPG